MSTVVPARAPVAEYRHFIWDTRRWTGFEHRAGDIFVCTPPKCGTTWTQTIIAMLLFPDGDLPAPVIDLAPWLEARFSPASEVLDTLAAQKHRRSVKTHTPVDGIPWWPDAKYIVVGRDGRDAFMSFVNHMASMRPDKVGELIESAVAEGIQFEAMPPQEDIHEFFNGWMQDGGFFHFLNGYWELRDQPNVLFVHFDDLKANLEGEVRRIAAFLGIPIDEKRLPGILERCSFAWMKSHADRIGDFGQMFVGGAESFLFKGTNGRWQGVLTPEELARYEQKSRELLPPDLKKWLDRGGTAPAATST
ncbi:MAG TPA: sulfotransferase domain-containing protein [Candidatus Binatia bacterium]|jgi:aryl sulfotransferase